MNSCSTARQEKPGSFELLLLFFSKVVGKFCGKIKKPVALGEVSDKLPFVAWEIDPNLNKNENFCGNFAQNLIYSFLSPEFSYCRRKKVQKYINESNETTHFGGIQPSD
ncbi:MAG: hypothetical protein FWC50_10215 [Planctomycetaceae bacterium]|nr:hypothetical protein [Planctomycetaceae bacterium]